MGGHRHRRVLERAERGEVGLQLRVGRLDDRQLDVAVGAGAAVAGNMLDHAGDAARLESVEHGPAERGHLHRLAAERPVADYVVRAFAPHVEQGQAIDVDPDLGERQCDRLGIDPRRFDRR